jgi:hypothetical protein
MTDCSSGRQKDGTKKVGGEGNVDLLVKQEGLS